MKITLHVLNPYLTNTKINNLIIILNAYICMPYLLNIRENNICEKSFAIA